MKEKDLQSLALEKLESDVGNMVIVLGFFEHQVDLACSILQDVVQEVGGKDAFSEQLQKKIEFLSKINQSGSIDFENLQSPLEAYKIPEVIETKGKIRTIQKMYLKQKLGQ